MHVGFTPDGDWFVFDESGVTLKRHFRARPHAENWVFNQMCPKAQGQSRPSSDHRRA